jgi:hypothetical protein
MDFEKRIKIEERRKYIKHYYKTLKLYLKHYSSIILNTLTEIILKA